MKTETLKKMGAHLYDVHISKQWETDGFDSMNHFIRFNAEAFCKKKPLDVEHVYAEMVKAFESHKRFQMIEAEVVECIAFEKKLSDYKKDTLTTFMSSWFNEKDQKLILKLLDGIEGCFIIEEHKNKAGAEITT